MRFDVGREQKQQRGLLEMDQRLKLFSGRKGRRSADCMDLIVLSVGRH